MFNFKITFLKHGIILHETVQAKNWQDAESKIPVGVSVLNIRMVD